MTLDYYSYLITLQVFQKTARLLIKNSPKYHVQGQDDHDQMLNEVAGIFSL